MLAGRGTVVGAQDPSGPGRGLAPASGRGGAANQGHNLTRPDLPNPFRIVETPTHIFLLTEAVHGYRQVFMDGRKHPSGEDLQPSWLGHSIGRWESNTLVVDTVGFNDQTWFDNVGHVHSDRMHVVERFTRQ